MEKLLGRTVLAVEVDSEDQHYMRFLTDAGPIAFGVSGDCCSESWFADVIGRDALIGGTVAKVETLELPEPPDQHRTRQDVDVAYGIRLTTERGHTTIAYRNSSNGYYGGFLENASARKIVNVKWKPIETDDWSA
jgi:hypothetical protein